jgi:hypothetical protein
VLDRAAERRRGVGVGCDAEMRRHGAVHAREQLGIGQAWRRLLLRGLGRGEGGQDLLGRGGQAPP